MPVDPFLQNYQIGNDMRSRSALRDELRQKAIEAQTVQNTQLDTNKVDLIKGLLSNIPNMQGAFGGVGAGTILQQFDPRFGALSGALTTPDSFTRVNDELTLDKKKAGARKDNASALASSAQAGMFQNPDGSITQIENPQERIAKTNASSREKVANINAASREKTAASRGTGGVKAPTIDITVPGSDISFKAAADSPQAAQFLQSQGYMYDANSGNIVPQGSTTVAPTAAQPSLQAPQGGMTQQQTGYVDYYAGEAQARGLDFEQEPLADGSVAVHFTDPSSMKTYTYIVPPDGDPYEE